MVRAFQRVRKQVDDRVAGRSPRGGINLGLNEVLTYLMELKAFHVKHCEMVSQMDASGTGDGALLEHEKEMLAAGEHFEEGIKAWLAGK